MKKIVLIFLVSITGSLCAQGQTMTPGTLNAAGGTGIIGTNEFDWSVGEMTMVSTFSGTGIIVTQGVLQPSDAMESVPNNNTLKNQLKVFPNPASTEVNIQYASQTQGTLTYRLMDLNGKLLRKQTINAAQGMTNEQVAIKELACATYMLEVTVNAGDAAQESISYKIQKIK